MIRRRGFPAPPRHADTHIGRSTTRQIDPHFPLLVQASFPHFRVEEREGVVGFYLHYHSTRGSLLAPFVKGLVTAVSQELFKQEIEITFEVNDHGAVFHVADMEGATANGQRKKADPEAQSFEAYKLAAQAIDGQYDLTFFLKCWPFFILLDEDLRIVSCGPSLLEKVPDAVPGALLQDLFQVLRPIPAKEVRIHLPSLSLHPPPPYLAHGAACIVSPCFGSAWPSCTIDFFSKMWRCGNGGEFWHMQDYTFKTFCKHCNVSFRIEAKTKLKSGSKLVLRGAMQPSPHGSQILFLCTIHMLNMDDMIAAESHMTDLPLHDSARDLLFMSETRSVVAKMNTRLDTLVLLRPSFPMLNRRVSAANQACNKGDFC